MKIQPTSTDSRSRLPGCSPFNDLAPALVEQILACMEERCYEPGETLIRQGDPGEGLLVLVEGTAQAVVRDESGGRAIASLVAGAVVGEMALVTGEPRLADVVAGSAVRALALPADAFHHLVREHPQLAVVLTRIVAERLGRDSNDGLRGKTVDRFRIRRCVGRGGMAVVYEAEDLTVDGRRVALKMMSHDLVYSPGALRRFEQEAKIVRTFEHPNIAKLYDLFTAYRTCFLVLEFCDGATLAQVMTQNGPLPEPLARAILGQLALALNYVHSLGFLHRDLKPGNVMLNFDGSVKLMDFGLARTQRIVGEDTSSNPAVVMGTPGYMAPEQIAGRTLDARADIYALACVTYALVAGRDLFSQGNYFDLVRSKIAPKLPPAGAIGLGISHEMHRLIEGGIAPEPTSRLQSLESIAEWAAPLDRADVSRVLAHGRAS